VDPVEIGPGNIVLAELPQRDGLWKKRPALLLRGMPPFGDFLACGVSTKLRQYVPEFDELILMDDIDFEKSGLVFPSLVRLGWLTVLPTSLLEGSIGNVDPDRIARLLRRLSQHLLV